MFAYGFPQPNLLDSESFEPYVAIPLSNYINCSPDIDIQACFSCLYLAQYCQKAVLERFYKPASFWHVAYSLIALMTISKFDHCDM